MSRPGLWKRLSLRQQLSLAMALVCLLALSLAGAVTLFQLHRQALQALDETMLSLGGLVANRSAAAVAFADTGGAKENLAALGSLPYVSLACLMDKQGTVLARHAMPGFDANCPPIDGRPGSQQYRLDVLMGNEGVGVLWLQANDLGLLQKLKPSLIALGAGLALALAIAMGAAVPLQRAMHRPLDRIRGVVQRVEESGDFQVRVPDLGEQELGRLARAFNRMLDTIQRQNASLIERERHARSLFDLSHFAQLVVDPHSKLVTDCNAAATALLIPDRASAIGVPLADILQLNEAQRIELLKLPLGQPTAVGLQLQRAGTPWFAELHLLGMERDGRRIVHAVVEDVTERQAHEQAQRELTAELERRVEERTRHLEQTVQNLNEARDQLVLAEKQAALARLVAGMAHEVNTPVGNARLAVSTIAEAQAEFSSAMQAQLRRSDLLHFMNQIREAHQLAERNLQRVVELVATFKQMSADQVSVERRQFDLAKLIEEILQLLGPQLRRSGCELTLSLEPDITMLSQAGPLEQVIVNLVQNALLHGFDGRTGGRLHIETRRLPGASGAELMVSDDGAGMTADVLARVFDPFFTTKLGRGGLGLGLPIVQGLVQKLLGGSLQIDSTPNAGTRVTIRLPLQAPQT